MNGMDQMNDTINYYNNNAETYFDSTVNADLSDIYQRFLKYLPEKSYILDAGCGSGRDSKFFISQCHRVKAIDGSKELCRLASDYLNQEVENIRFSDLDYHEEFDGIWACASLLHVDRNEIQNVINKMYNALKDNGIFYASFKYGSSDRMQGERYYNDINEDQIKKLFQDFIIQELWFSDDVRTDRTDRWINVIVKKERDINK